MDAFISYSRKDKTFVQKLHQALKQRQKELWVDWKDIPLTSDWWAEIQAGIEATDAFVFVISPDSVTSKVCQQEIEHAQTCNKRLVPLVYRDAEGIPETLSHLNWLFFRETDDFEMAIENLLQVMATDLDWVKRHTRLTQRAVEWDKKRRNPSYLLRGDDLAEAEQHLSQPDRKPGLTHLQQEYIVSSQQQQAADLMHELEQSKKLAETEKRRLEEQKLYSDKLQKRLMVIIAGLVLIIALGGYATFRTLREGALARSAEEVVNAVVEYANAEANGDVCWAGVLYSIPQIVMPACERAVTLAPEVAYYYESRGLAKALMGKFPEAGTDFKSAIELARASKQAKERLVMWENWVEIINRGENPFDGPTMQHLRERWESEQHLNTEPTDNEEPQ